MGDAYDKAGKKEEALKSFQEIFENDIRYKDVSKRIDVLTA